MLQNLRHLVGFCYQAVRSCKIPERNFSKEQQLLKTMKCELCLVGLKKNFHTNSPPLYQNADESAEKRKAVKEKRKMVGLVEGAESCDMDFALKSSEDVFPTVDLPNTLFNGIPFKDLPIIHIHISRNNTIMTLSHQGQTKLNRSCGFEGFKNTRKGTNIAAQTLGIGMGLRVLKKGYKTVRILLKGLGPGRMSGVQGLHLSGLDIVSITDRSPDVISDRPKKQRRL